MASMRIDQVRNTTREQRVAAHTHIKGLGLRDDGSAEPIAAGFVGQENAREVSTCSMIQLSWLRNTRKGQQRLRAI